MPLTAPRYTLEYTETKVLVVTGVELKNCDVDQRRRFIHSCGSLLFQAAGTPSFFGVSLA